MNKSDWKTRYIDQLIKRGLEKEIAEEAYEADYNHYSYSNPEDVADYRFVYWDEQ